VIEAECNCNPWALIGLGCTRCFGLGRIAGGANVYDSAPCPNCSSPTEAYTQAADKNRRTLPTLRKDELTEDERALFGQWRARGYHELNCLRWIEGRRYDPSKDADFRKEVHKALVKACFLHEQPEPSFTP
jgi:hypothetical protein